MNQSLLENENRRNYKEIINCGVTIYFLAINSVLLGYVVSMYSILHNFGDIGEEVGNKAHCLIEYICSSTLFGGDICNTCLR